MRRARLRDGVVARSLDETGDRWALLIIADAFSGTKRFSDFQQRLGLAENILNVRLRMLISNGILETRPSTAASGEYHLTEKGRRLRTVLRAASVRTRDHWPEKR
jgi:DNA-binding HxlR family transcriptional regulator